MARRERDERIRYFIPHGGQEEFIKLITDPGAFIVNSGAGNGWGKSEFLVALFAAVMWPHMAPPCFQHPVFSDWKFPKRARIYSKPAELEEIGSLQTAIQKLFPVGQYQSSKGRYSYPNTFRTSTGWILDLFSYERQESEAAGPNIGLQAFNEPPPHELWKEGVARSRAGGIILGGMTSLLDNVWVASGIFDKANGKDVRVRFGSSCENCKQHGKNGHLEHDQIEKILSQYDQDEREARFTGKPLSFSGAIFKGFDRAVHVAKEPLVAPTYGVAIYQVVDPAIGRPCAVIWAWVDATGRLFICDEHPEIEFEGARDSNLTVREYAVIFKAREGRAVEARILDRHFGGVRRTLGGLTLKQEFAEAGLDYLDSYSVGESIPEVETGILKVKEYLRYDKSKPIDSLNQPKLVISPTCHNTIRAMERWSRNPKTGKPNEEGKDFADCVRYLVMADPKIEPKRTWERGPMARYGVS